MAENRQQISVEFLNKLKALFGVGTQAEFARRCGQQPPNMNAYLNGSRVPGDRVLVKCISSMFEWQVNPLKEIIVIPNNLSSLPDSGGVYILYDSAGNVLYIGKANKFRQEVRQTLNRPIPVGMRLGPRMNKIKPRIKDLASYLSMYEIENARLRHNIESTLATRVHKSDA